jgi:RNA polymerase sigma-70 factor (ECF subfamily)
MAKVTAKRLSKADADPLHARRVTVNGQPGNALVEPGGTLRSVLSIDVVDDQIQTVRITRNPDKLAHLRL